MSSSDVFFYSDGERLAGYLHAPDAWKPGDALRPAIVVLAGYSGNTRRIART